MSNWKVNAPKTVKGPDKATALARARNLTTVSKIVPLPAPDFLIPPPSVGAIFHDPCTAVDPIPIWGSFSGEGVNGQGGQHTKLTDVAPGRLVQHPSGGPNNLPCRSITVFPGDDSWGNRAALGLNSWDSPVALYREGEYHLTTLWVKLGAVNQTGNWRQIFETKQAEPYPAGMSTDLGPLFEVQQHNGEVKYEAWWNRIDGGTDMYSAPVTTDWTPFSIEGFYSADPAKGWLRVKQGARTSQTFIKRPTLLKNTQTGETVPAYLAVGPYQDPSLPGVTVSVADVRVYG